MTFRRFPAIIAGVAAALLLPAACTSSGPTSTTSTSHSPVPTARSSVEPPAATPATSRAAQALAAKLRGALDILSSAYIIVDAGTLGGVSAGDVTFARGATTASDVTVGSGSTRSQIVTIGSTSYAKVPAAQNSSGKPWLKVSADSSNQFVRGLAGALQISTAVGSLPAIADVVAAASSVRAGGRTRIGGAAVQRYDLEVRPTAAGTSTLASVLGEIGHDTVPVTLYLDARDRPVEVRVSVAIGGASFALSAKISHFDAAVRIAAPPRDQVGTG